jgi:hypothetical protein
VAVATARCSIYAWSASSVVTMSLYRRDGSVHKSHQQAMEEKKNYAHFIKQIGCIIHGSVDAGIE